MPQTVAVIEHSVGPAMQECVTFLASYPRWIHAEARTHRMMAISEEYPDEALTPSIMEARELARNASSSRAIPVRRMIDDLRRNPAIPEFWGKNARGMQANEECHEAITFPEGDPRFPGQFLTREGAWLFAMETQIWIAEAYERAGYAKQIVNRLLEPFSHITVVITASHLRNFFALRDHEDAEPHIRDVARKMKEALRASVPRRLAYGEWHLPFVTEGERSSLSELTLLEISSARCARTSYLTHDKQNPVLTEDIALFNRLARSSGPMHASPMEHQARPDRPIDLTASDDGLWENPRLAGPLVGWQQHRRLLPGEAVRG